MKTTRVIKAIFSSSKFIKFLNYLSFMVVEVIPENFT